MYYSFIDLLSNFLPKSREEKLHAEAKELLERYCNLYHKPKKERTVSDVLGLEIDFAVLTTKYAKYYDDIGCHKVIIRSEVQDLINIDCIRSMTYKIADLKIGKPFFDGLLDDIEQCGAKGEYIIPENGAMTLRKKRLICDTMSAVYSVVEYGDNIYVANYNRIMEDYEFYSEAINTQFKTKLGYLIMRIEKNITFAEAFGSMFDQNPTPKTYGIIRK